MLPVATASTSRLQLAVQQFRVRSWNGSGGTTVNSAADMVAGLPLLLARCFFLPLCRTSPLSSSPNVWRRRLQDLIYLARKHPKIMVGGELFF